MNEGLIKREDDCGGSTISFFLDTKENGRIDCGRGWRCSYGVMVYREKVKV